MRWLIACGALVALLALSRPAPVSVSVTGGGYEPATVRLKVHVEPDDTNRVLVVWVGTGTGEGYERMSSYMLDADSLSTRWLEYRNVPAGAYTAVALVDRGGKTVTASTTFTILAR